MLKWKNIVILIKRNLKIICSYNMLRARTFRARRKSLGACYVLTFERTDNFLRPVDNGKF